MIKLNLCDKGVGLNGKRMAGCDGALDMLKNTHAGSVLLNQRNLEKALSCISGRVESIVGTLEEEVAQACKRREQRDAESQGLCTGHEMLGERKILQDHSRVSRCGGKPCEDLVEVLVHFGGSPGLVTGKGGNVVPVALVGKNPDQSIVGDTAAECAPTRIENTLFFGSTWRIWANMILVGPYFVGKLWIPFLAILVLVMIDEDIPSQGGILGDNALVSGDRNVQVSSRIGAGFDEKGFEAFSCESTSQRSTPCPTAHDDVVVLDISNDWISSNERRMGQQREKKMMGAEPHGGDLGLSNLGGGRGGNELQLMGDESSGPKCEVGPFIFVVCGTKQYQVQGTFSLSMARNGVW